MHQQNEILEVLKALDRSVALAPTDSEELANDEDVFMQVIELDYQEKPLSVRGRVRGRVLRFVRFAHPNRTNRRIRPFSAEKFQE